MKTMKLTGIVLVLLFAFHLDLTVKLKAVQPTPVPTSLPIGSEKQILDFAVTNTSWRANGMVISMYWQISFPVTGGVADETATSDVTNPFLDSFDAFQRYGASNMVIRLGVVKARKDLVPGATIRYAMALSYVSPSSHTVYAGFSSDTNLGPIANVTSNQFYHVKPSFEQVAIFVPGLQGSGWAFDVGGATRTYGWGTMSSLEPRAQNVFVQPTLPPDRSTNDVLVISQWDATGGYWGDFILDVGGQQVSYNNQGRRTQGADERLVITPTFKGLEILPLQGTSTTVMFSSTTQGSWSVLTNFLSQPMNSIVRVPLVCKGPSKFFRVYTTQ